MARDLDELVAACTADYESFNAGMERARETVAAVETEREWKDAQPLTHGDVMSITHNFDGEEREFFVKPTDAAVFEACLPGRSAYACLQRFVDSTWTVDDVAAVLSLALYGPSPIVRMAWRNAKLALDMGFASSVPTQFSPHPKVTAAVTRDGPANFASLAAEILTDVLFREAETDGYGGAVDAAA